MMKKLLKNLLKAQKTKQLTDLKVKIKNKNFLQEKIFQRNVKNFMIFIIIILKKTTTK